VAEADPVQDTQVGVEYDYSGVHRGLTSFLCRTPDTPACGFSCSFIQVGSWVERMAGFEPAAFTLAR
jgi:hypothetical protein